jgi:hypothetical protein
MLLFEEFTEKELSVEEIVTRVKSAMERMKLEHPETEFSFRPMVVVPGAKHQWVVADIDFKYPIFLGVRGEYSAESIQQLMAVRQQLGLRVDHLETLYIIKMGARRF